MLGGFFIICLPMTIKEIQVGYLTSHYFKNIYLYWAQNKLPSSRVAVRQVETQSGKCLKNKIQFNIYLNHVYAILLT